MLHVYGIHDGKLAVLEGVTPESASPAEAVWIDLVAPSEREEEAVERWLGIDIPTREEREEIEASSRLYEQDGAAFMTATLVSRADTPRPESSVVTFILNAGALVTVRYAELKAFDTFVRQSQRQAPRHATGQTLLAGLLDAVVDRLADVLEAVGAGLDEVSRQAFADDGSKKTGRDFQALLGRIGRNGDLISKAGESLVSLARLIAFARQLDAVRGDHAVAARFKTLAQDVASLNDHTGFLNNKIGFLLDAIFGMISIEQNATIKIFSVVAVIFLPPTLIASIYGMNFEYMPELGWPFGYPLALLLMLVSAVLPYALFKYRGWL